MTGTPISFSPTDGLCYDPSEPIYWEKGKLAHEVTRAFEICHGCRMCFKYCDSFPTLFDLIDEKHSGDVTRLSSSETNRVMNACFQCKLCEVQCPYTPRDGHEFQLDFPKLVHRYQAVRAKSKGVGLRGRILGDPDRTSKLARSSFGLANAANRVSIHRWFMEKFLGVHRKKLLPEFASQTFERWAQSRGRMRIKPGGEAVLFQTCYVQNNEPEIGRDTLTVLDKNRVDVGCVPGLECCGMPAWENGDLGALRGHARKNLDALLPHVRAGAVVLAINPTCSMMMRREYPELVAPEDRERARQLAAAVRDPSEYLWSIRKEQRFNTDFKSSPGARVAYHAPCHLRAPGRGLQGPRLAAQDPRLCPRHDDGVLRPRRHVRDDGRGLRALATHRPKGLFRHARGRGRGLGHGLSAGGPAVRAAWGQETDAPDVDPRSGLSRRRVCTEDRTIRARRMTRYFLERENMFKLRALLPLLLLTSCFTSELRISNETMSPMVPYPVVTSPPPPHREADPSSTLGVGDIQTIDTGGFNPLYYASGITDPQIPNALFIGLDLHDADPPLIQHRLMHYPVPPGQEGTDPALQPIVIVDKVEEVPDKNLIINVFEGPVDRSPGTGWKVQIVVAGS